MVLEIVLVFLSLIAIGIAGYSWWRLNILQNKIRGVFQSEKIDNVDELLESYAKKFQTIDNRLDKAFTELQSHSIILNYTLHKVAIKRFNPFADMGGDTSFTTALLNNENSGILITYIATREQGGRSYAKPIEKGRSNQQLSQEETEVLAAAINTTLTNKL
ncbi:MAG: hypothetical protein RLZZ223_192 [Candidatus Parcubacteria bacterium]|jgi:hypothetical protein